MILLHASNWIIGGTMFLGGFFFCMFLGLTIMYYTTIQERKKAKNEFVNGRDKENSTIK